MRSPSDWPNPVIDDWHELWQTVIVRPVSATSPSIVRVVRRNAAELTTADRERIQRFIKPYMLYEREALDATLNAATYIWLCLDEAGDIVGTTAVRRIELPRGVGKHRRSPVVVYTSVVAIDPAHRRAGLPARMGLKTYLLERLRAPLRPLYWLAEAASPSGYLQMARNLATFWPRPNVVMPPKPDAVLRAALRAAGITRVERVAGAYRVFEDFGVIEREQAPDRWDRTDADVDYFLQANPDYWTGTSLVCLAPLNIVAVANAVIGVGLRVRGRRRQRQSRG